MEDQVNNPKVVSHPNAEVIKACEKKDAMLKELGLE